MTPARAVVLLAGMAACGPATGDADDVCALEYDLDELDGEARTVGALLDGDEGDVHVQIRWPSGTARGDDRWPVAVVIQGSWDGQGTPIADAPTHVDVRDGLVEVHLDHPGSGLSEGTDDRRGPAARAAVATVLRYAAGRIPDQGGCTLAARTLAGDSDEVYLLGASNGGNLAMATLADAALDLPPIAGLVLWETPPGAPFATVQFGNDPTVYEPGSCARGTDGAVRCPVPEALLTQSERDLCFDLDGDGACTEADAVVNGITDPLTEARMVAPELVEVLDARGEPHPGYADAASARAWWAERDAAQLAAAVVAAWPELPVMLLASQEDHVLWGLSDHPHVYALGEALQAAGVRWLRLNPGAERLPAEVEENPPNAPVRLDDPHLTLLSEEDETPLEGAYAAALLELVDRTAAEEW